MLGEYGRVIDLDKSAFQYQSVKHDNIRVGHQLPKVLEQHHTSSTRQSHLEAFVGLPSPWCSVAMSELAT